MTVQSTNNRNDYVGNGSANVYPYTFRIFEASDLIVVVRDPADGSETQLQLSTHYTVSGVGEAAGGNITLVNGAFDWLDSGGDLESGWVIAILRVLPLTQQTDIRNQGAYFPEIHEDQFDRIAMIEQQQDDEIARSLKLPRTVNPSTFDNNLPGDIGDPANAGRTVILNPSADGWDLGPNATDIANAQANAAAAAASALAASSSAANALASENAALASEIAAAASESSAAAYALASASFRPLFLTAALSPYTVTSADRGRILVCDTALGGITINLPTIAGLDLTNPFPLAIKKSTTDVNIVSIVRSSTDTIDAATVYAIREIHEAVCLYPSTSTTPNRWVTTRLSPTVIARQTLAGLIAIPREEGKVYYATDVDKLFIDNGATLLPVGSGSSGINYISNPDAEADASGWLRYNDGDTATPVDGIGGSPTTDFGQGGTLRGNVSFRFEKPASNCRGQGVATDFVIDYADFARQLTISFDYITSGGTYDGDVSVFVYDVGNGVLIPVTNPQIPKVSETLGGQYVGFFQSAPAPTSYRLLFHITTAATGSYTLNFDNVRVGPGPVAFAAPVTDATAYTPTLNSTTNVAANNARWWRVGRYMMIEGAVRYSGTGAAGAFSVSLPAGFSVDSTVQFDGGDTASQIMGFWGWFDNSGSAASRGGFVIALSNNVAFAFRRNDTSNSVDSSAFAADDRITYQLRVPILGWGSNVQVGGYDGRTVAEKMTRDGTGQTLSQANASRLFSLSYLATTFSTHGALNTTTGVVTAPVAGFYDVSFSALCSYASSSGNVLVQIVRGGAVATAYDGTQTALAGGDTMEALQQLTAVGVSFSSASISTRVFLSAGETVQVVITKNLGGTNLNVAWTQFSVNLVPGRSTLAAGDTIAFAATKASGSAANGTADVASYTTEFDLTGSFNATTGVFTAPIAGCFAGDACVSYAANATGSRSLEIQVNGVTVRTGPRLPGVSANDVGVSLGFTLRLNAGDQVKVRSVQTSGGALNFSTVTAATSFTMRRVGA